MHKSAWVNDGYCIFFWKGLSLFLRAPLHWCENPDFPPSPLFCCLCFHAYYNSNHSIKCVEDFPKPTSSFNVRFISQNIKLLYWFPQNPTIQIWWWIATNTLNILPNCRWWHKATRFLAFWHSSDLTYWHRWNRSINTNECITPWYRFGHRKLLCSKLRHEPLAGTVLILWNHHCSWANGILFKWWPASYLILQLRSPHLGLGEHQCSGYQLMIEHQLVMALWHCHQSCITGRD